LESSKLHYYEIERGEYSSRESLWFSHPKYLSAPEIIRRIVAVWDKAYKVRQVLVDERNEEMQELFGIEANEDGDYECWDHGKLLITRGTDKEFYKWQNKWAARLGEHDTIVIALELAGFTVLYAENTQIHVGWDYNEYFENLNKDNKGERHD
jgi:hypothetical protein